MYPVSEAFLQAVQENTRRYYWTGKTTTTKGATYEFGADDIVKGSGYIFSQCCGSTDVGRILRTCKIKKNVEVTDNGKDNF